MMMMMMMKLDNWTSCDNSLLCYSNDHDDDDDDDKIETGQRDSAAQLVKIPLSVAMTLTMMMTTMMKRSDFQLVTRLHSFYMD